MSFEQKKNSFYFLKSDFILAIKYRTLLLIMLNILNNLLINVFPKSLTLYARDKKPISDCKLSRVM